MFGPTSCIRAGLSLLAATALAFAASAQTREDRDAADFYHTHTVRFVSGGGPGGGYDNYARLLAPHGGP